MREKIIHKEWIRESFDVYANNLDAMNSAEKKHTELTKQYPQCRIQMDFSVQRPYAYFTFFVFEPVLKTVES